MKNHQNATQKVLETFPENYKLDPQTRLIHLIEEVVELGITISKYLDKIPGNAAKKDIEEDFGGILFDVFTLANQLGINLDTIYPKELKKFKKYSSR